MNVLVLGASSGIGESLAMEFAAQNRLFLSGRQVGRLERLAGMCRKTGALSASVLEVDLRSGVAAVLSGLETGVLDLCINAASATSQLRDDELSLGQMRAYTEVDLLAPFDLVLALRNRQPEHPPRMVFVSSVLASLPSPNRSIYGSMKRLQEACLMSAGSRWPELDVRIVRVGKVLPPGLASAESARLARFVRRMLAGNRRVVTWGLAGRALTALFYVQPIACRLAITALRNLRDGGRRQTTP